MSWLEVWVTDALLELGAAIWKASGPARGRRETRADGIIKPLKIHLPPGMIVM